MGQHKIKKGLTLPITGAPGSEVVEGAAPRHVAILGSDYIGMKPTMHVSEGDVVRRGQLLFEDKKTAGVRFTAPAAGKVTAINRGARRVFQSVVIELDEDERSGLEGKGAAVSFDAYSGKDPAGLGRDQVQALLLESGLWTALRARPFGRVADPAASPHSIFITAMDSNPLAPSVTAALQGREEDFQRGIHVVAKLTEGSVFLCKAPGDAIPTPSGVASLQVEEFSGPHPAGTVGVHIHHLDPVDRSKTVWHLGYEDVAAMGHLFATGKLDCRRVVSVAGPAVAEPSLVRTRLGAATSDLLEGRLNSPSEAGDVRVISGSVFSGRQADGEIHGFLGRFDNQVSVIAEDSHRAFLGWLSPGGDKFSTVNVFLSKLFPSRKFAFTTSTQGSPRAMVPIGSYEKVLPMDLLPTFLLRSLYVTDVERAEELGCLELSEEDLALCSFVCPGKTDWGPKLREVLTILEKEG
ncbi:MAG: Na(+)-translocating NADH-quinone reductase subunit A [Deltaproteobacteria bacterium]|nr:Na(+)-translocating NADH-quinone reductase subunit A [Deltaproteobacteria bacterium]